jgi:hypothetical protein
MTELPKSPDCECQSLCCPRCQRRLALAKALETGTQVSVRMTLTESDQDLAPDGYPWPDVPYEAHLE